MVWTWLGELAVRGIAALDRQRQRVDDLTLRVRDWYNDDDSHYAHDNDIAINYYNHAGRADDHDDDGPAYYIDNRGRLYYYNDDGSRVYYDFANIVWEAR